MFAGIGIVRTDLFGKTMVIRMDLFGKVVLSGGTTMFASIGEGMTKELTALDLHSIQVFGNSWHPPSYNTWHPSSVDTIGIQVLGRHLTTLDIRVRSLHLCRDDAISFFIVCCIDVAFQSNVLHFCVCVLRLCVLRLLHL